MVEYFSASEIPAKDPFEGTVYRLVRQLARGGMGQVFLVEHRQLGRKFVAKLLKDDLVGDSQLLDRFRIEAQSLGKLRHANIVAIVGFGNTRDNRPFLVTEYLQGQTIAQQLASGVAFTVHDAIRYARETLSALAAAHELGIVHRDIKPDNLFIQQHPDGSTQIKVLDFGLARVIPGISPEAPEPLAIPTNTGLVFGTPHYVSPEGALGKHVDHRADIYGVGLVLYAMLVGRGPFEHANSRLAAMTAHVTEVPVTPSTVARIPIPTVLDVIVLKALEKHPDARFQTAKEFDALLSDAANLPASAIRAVDTVERKRFEIGNPKLPNSTDTAFEVPVADNTSVPTSPSWPVLVVLVLFSAIAVVTGGWFLIFAKHGGP